MEVNKKVGTSILIFQIEHIKLIKLKFKILHRLFNLV